jgi:hypothetical protein
MLNIPISRKVIATAIAGGVFALLRTIGVFETSPDLTGWITVGAGLGAGVLVSEGSKYVNHFLERRNLPFRVEDKA